MPPFSTFTQASAPGFPLVQGQPWALLATWRSPAPAGQPVGSGPLINLTGASASCRVTWAGGSVQCTMGPLDANGAPVPSLTPQQTSQVQGPTANAHLNITDTAGNSFNFLIPLQVFTP